MAASEEKPLTPKEAKFVEAFLACGNQAQAAREAGYAEKSSRVSGRNMMRRPHVRAAVGRAARALFREGIMEAEEIMCRLSRMARVDITDFIDVAGNGAVSLKALKDIPKEKRQGIKSVKVGKDGALTVEIAPPREALDALARHHGLFDRYRHSRREPDAVMRDILRQVREEALAPSEAALRLDEYGLPLPESLRLLLMKTGPEPADPTGGAYMPVSPEEMMARHAARMREIEDQRKNFVPQRREEVRAIKEELGQGRRAFAAGAPDKERPGAGGGEE